MCLTIPKQVSAVKKDFVEVKSAKGKERLGALIRVKKGDWVLSQNQVIVSKISTEQAKEINNLIK